jgi:hypothetical protein
MAYELVIGSNRLFAAADLLLAAIESETGKDSVVPVYLEDPCSDWPPPKRVFTRIELIEAMKLLIRMGFVESVSRPR